LQPIWRRSFFYVSALSDYLNAHIPAGWSKPDVIRAVGDRLDRTTVYRYLAGNHSRNPPEYVLDAFARALPGCSITELREAAGAAVGEEDPWIPPLEANRLTHAQRAALEAFIRTIVQADPAQTGAPPPNSGPRTPEVTIQEVRAYIAQLRATGQDELAGRLEASLETTSSASHTANKSSKP
jgi:hypothetical protein